MAKFLLGIDENAANSNAIVLRLLLLVNWARRSSVYLPKQELDSPVVKQRTYHASGLARSAKAEFLITKMYRRQRNC